MQLLLECVRVARALYVVLISNRVTVVCVRAAEVYVHVPCDHVTVPLLPVRVPQAGQQGQLGDVNVLEHARYAGSAAHGGRRECQSG